DEHANIGRRDTYVSFLMNMKEVFRECFRVLEPGRKICVNTANVNQFTEHGLLTFPIAADFCVILRELGFVMVNELIWSKDKTGGRWGSANDQRPIFGSYPYPPNFLFKNVHEYILVFAKPGGELRKGEKVRLYSELMGMQLKEIAVETEEGSNKTPPCRPVQVRRKS
ncbi:DNA methylase N-4/N-6 domain protein, partial [mine drainage metagenome]